MGYSTSEINKELALALSKKWEVTEGSIMDYFTSDSWKGMIQRAEIKDNNKAIIYRLYDGSFVVLEATK